jgi:putative toxin-antitoxin system antitoxin component (TIGR02293 family)
MKTMAGKTTKPRVRKVNKQTRAAETIAARTGARGHATETGRFMPASGEKAAASLDKWFKRFGYTEGGPDTLGGELRVAMQVQQGFPIRAVEDVIDAGMIEPRMMYEIVVPRRTLAHRKQKDQPLTPEQSDRLARILRVYSRAEEALGSLDKASRWLHKGNRALRGKRPVELLGTDAGSRAVEKILGRIEHGIFS